VAKKKKNKKSTAKKRAKSKHEKQKKRQLTLVKRRPKPSAEPDIPLMPRPAFAEMEAPDGFMSIPMSQAMFEYAKPLMEMAGSSDVEDMNKIMEICTALWNYDIAMGEGREDQEIKLQKLTLKSIKTTFGMDDDEAKGLFNEMIERKNYLFPPEIQPKVSMYLFIRKEISHLITAFNYGDLDISNEPLPPDDEDRGLVDKINRMDRYIAEGNDYDEWEDHYFSMEEECTERFAQWLDNKGMEEYSDEFPFCVEMYLDFIYRYMHDDIVTLRSVPRIYIQEFFEDYVLRKVMLDSPQEYVIFPPALKMFYMFLFEKGYLDDAQPVTKKIDEIEADFIGILKKRFG
jgi:hypothetical protein